MQFSLDQLKVNQSAQIVAIKNSFLKVKMMEMGLYIGKQLTLQFQAPFGGPMAFDLKGNILSLRKDEAQKIQVQLIEKK